jgi:hypothetical protein
MTRLRISIFTGLLMAILASAALAGGNDPITRSEILSRAAAGVGFSYWWRHGRWNWQHTNLGSCSGNCPNCTHSGSYGADCSGYVAKCWDVGSSRDITVDEHPFVASQFSRNGPYWRVIQRSELQGGDALGSSSHVVLFDSFGSGGMYWVYEARGCSYGIVHRQRSCGSGYTPVRRNNLDSRPPCDPNACSGHGREVGGRCVCDKGYSGPNCDHCSPGYTGYPNCHPENAVCNATREINCGDVVTGNNSSGTNSMVNYNPQCGNWDETGNEVVFKFKPWQNSKVTAKLSNMPQGVDVDMFILADVCDNNSCIEYGNSEAYFTVQAFREYYIVVDGWPESQGQFSLSLTCQNNAGGRWIGDPCESDNDCVYQDPVGGRIQLSCYARGQAKFCSMSCSKYCPDKPGKAAAFCVADPANQNNGMCVAKPDTQINGCCGYIPGTQLSEKTRYGGSDKSWVCYPKMQ